MLLQAKAPVERVDARREAERTVQSDAAPALFDSRPATVAQRELAEAMNDSPRVAAQRSLAGMLNDHPRVAVQRQLQDRMAARSVQRKDTSEDELLQGQFKPMQRAERSPEPASDRPSRADAMVSVAHSGPDHTVQLARNAPRTTGSLLRERLSAGADTASVLGGLGIGGAVTAIAAANSWNPLGWGLAAGIGAGLAGTALLSYLRGPANAQRESDRRFGLENYSEATDPDWTPSDVANRHFTQAQSGETTYPLETASHDWKGESTRLDTGAGMITFHKGWGGQPYIRTRADDFGGAAVNDDYDSLVGALSDNDAEVEEERAHNILRMAHGEQVDVSGEPGIVRRAMSFLLGMTQIAEENPKRSPGSAGLARASLRLIADGVSTFFEQFNRKTGQYVPAHIGGTDQMRDVVSGTHALDETLAGNISDDET